MAENSKIEWTHHTFNPWLGCHKVSPGCANCYAENQMDTRWGRVKWGKGQPRQRTSKEYWKKPLSWNARCKAENKRQRVFCASQADVFDDEVAIEWLAELLAIIHATPLLDWLLLTKRPENVGHRLGRSANFLHNIDVRDWVNAWRCGKPPENVWMGVSAEDQERADCRIPLLLDIPAKIRFLSVEPMLGPIRFVAGCPCGKPLCGGKGPIVDWVIFGGESGDKARPCNAEWIRAGVRQCRDSGAAPFVKQLGSDARHDTVGTIYGGPNAGHKINIQNTPMHLRHPKGGDWNEWPEDLRVREFPKV